MKANELRIGNWVEGRSDSKKDFLTFQVYKETFFDIESTYGEFKPIPLTEEWLVKFGFKKFKGGISLDNEEFTLTYTHKNTDKTILLEVNGEDEWGKHQYTCIVLNHIKYVHQLQNLYFTLTGEELTFKSE
jgi:hypothetical protein